MIATRDLGPAPGVEPFFCKGCGRLRDDELPCRVELFPARPVIRCETCFRRMLTILTLDLDRACRAARPDAR